MVAASYVPVGRPHIARTYTPSASLAQLDDFLATVPADGGSSVLLPSGKVLWLFGDTANVGHNSAAVQSGSRFDRLPGEFLPSKADAWYWPGQAVIDGGHLVVPFGEVTAGGFGVLSGIVTATYDPTTLRLLYTSRVGASITWGTTVVKYGGQWWLYGTRAASDTDPMKDVYVRTAPLGHLDDPATWGTPRKVLGESFGAGTILSVIVRGSGILLATKHADLLTPDFVTSTAPGPLGPYSSPKVVASPVVPADSWSYAAYLHPEQPHAAGQVVLTYAVNGNRLDSAFHCYATSIAG